MALEIWRLRNQVHELEMRPIQSPWDEKKSNFDRMDSQDDLSSRIRDLHREIERANYMA